MAQAQAGVSMELVTIIACIIVASISGLAVFYPDYDDTLFERVGLSCICIGSLATAWFTWYLQYAPLGITITSIGGAFFALEQGRKIRKRL